MTPAKKKKPFGFFFVWAFEKITSPLFSPGKKGNIIHNGTDAKIRNPTNTNCDKSIGGPLGNVAKCCFAQKYCQKLTLYANYRLFESICQ